jgi:hypothetical protein
VKQDGSSYCLSTYYTSKWVYVSIENNSDFLYWRICSNYICQLLCWQLLRVRFCLHFINSKEETSPCPLVCRTLTCFKIFLSLFRRLVSCCECTFVYIVSCCAGALCRPSAKLTEKGKSKTLNTRIATEAARKNQFRALVVGRMTSYLAVNSVALAEATI